MANNTGNTSPVQRINPEDVPGAPSWLPSLLGPINLFIQSTNSALNGNLQIPLNISAQIATLQFTTGPGTSGPSFIPQTFKCTLPYAPSCVIIGNIAIVSTTAQIIENATSLQWSYTTGTVSINNITGLTSNTSYTLTVLVF